MVMLRRDLSMTPEQNNACDADGREEPKAKRKNSSKALPWTKPACLPSPSLVPALLTHARARARSVEQLIKRGSSPRASGVGRCSRPATTWRIRRRDDDDASAASTSVAPEPAPTPLADAMRAARKAAGSAALHPLLVEPPAVCTSALSSVALGEDMQRIEAAALELHRVSAALASTTGLSVSAETDYHFVCFLSSG